MCGIAAFSGRKSLKKEQALIAVNKMKILGLYNESRGSHGCGLYINGTIYKGIEDFTTKKDTKLFKNFISDPNFIWPSMDITRGNVIILHTRMATSGAHTEANTHPFYIDSIRDGENLVGVHNGTLDNVWELCRKYNFDYLERHVRVDSHALYYLIDRAGLDVLKEYKGAAALVWSKVADPHSLYVYHGESKSKDRNDKTLWVERPMFYLKTAEGIYFSSMENSLNAIRESDKQEVIELDCNKVLQVKDGNFTDFSFEVDRIEANVPVATSYGSTGLQQGHSPIGFNSNSGPTRTPFTNLRQAVQAKKNGSFDKILGTPTTSLVWSETKPAKALFAKDSEVIYFWRGRYYRSGTDILCNGVMYIGDRGIIGNEGMEGFRPFWFYHGVMMRSIEAYEALIIESNLPNSWVHSLSSNYAYDISRYSAHPVTHLISESVDADPFFRYSWYLDERRVEECKLRPDFSGRCYEIIDGFLKNIIGSNGNDRKTIEGPTDIESTGKEDENVVIDGQVYPASSSNTCEISGRSSKNPWRCTTSVFDIVFKDINVLAETINNDEIEACANFIEDQFKKENINYTEQTIVGEMWTSIRTGCAAGKTIREALNDKTSVLDAYLAIVKEEQRMQQTNRGLLPAPTGDIPFEVDSIEEMLAIGESVIIGMKETYVGVQKNETPFPNSLDEVVQTESFHEDQTDEPLIDAAVREDQRRNIDQTFLRFQQRNLEREGQLVEAIKSCEGVVTILGELSSDAEQLSVNDSDLAQDVCSTLRQGLDMIKSSLSEDFDRHHQDALTKVLYLEVPSNI